MKEKEIVFNPYTINILAIIFVVPLFFLMAIVYEQTWIVDDKSFLYHFITCLKETSVTYVVLYVLSILIGILIHELIHGLFFSIFSPNGFKDVKFGFSLKAFAPYAHCDEPLKKNQYILAVLAPGIILGILPLIFCFIIGNIIWYSWAILFTVTAIGDFLVFFRILFVKKDRIILDHPSKVGFIVKWNE